jgi:hypothetical protein
MNTPLPVDILSSDFVWSWYQDQRNALLSFFNDIQKQSISSTIPAPFNSKFMTLQELEEEKLSDCDELDKLTILFIVATAEANIRMDFKWRAKKRLKDEISKQFSQIHKDRPTRIRLEDDILNIWSNFRNGTDSKKIIGHFKGLLKYRHWLAHGRSWQQQIGQPFTPESALDISEQLFTSLPIKSNWHPQESFEAEL